MKKYLIIIFSLAVLSCSDTPQVDLSYSDKKEDVKYLCEYFSRYSPFQEQNREKYAVLHIDSACNYYCEILKNSDDDSSFVQIIQAIVELGGRSGHSNLLTNSQIKSFKRYSLSRFNPIGISINDISKGEYWSDLYNSLNYYCHAPFKVKRDNDIYSLASDWIDSVNNFEIPAKSKVVSVNGLKSRAFMDSTISHSWFNYYTYNKEWVRDFLFIIDCGNMHQGWDVKFEVNEVLKNHFVPKLEGKSDKSKNVDTSENCFCLALNKNIAYIKAKSFAGEFYKQDKQKISDFFDKHPYQFDELIIDLRDNNGGVQKYGYNLLINPFLKENREIEFTLGFKEEFISNTSKREMNFYRLRNSDFLQTKVKATAIVKPFEYKESDFVFYKTIKKFQAKDTYPFDGEIIVLVNDGVFSATEDFVTAFKRLKMGEIVGERTSGGAAGYIMSPFIKLPNSGILIRIETEFILNEDAGMNEVNCTEPDIYISNDKLPKSTKPEEILMTLVELGLLNE